MNAVAIVTALTGLWAVLVACSASDQPASSPGHRSAHPTGGTPSSGSRTGNQAPASTGDPGSTGQTRIQVTVGDEHFDMTLDGSPASQDLIRQLPLTVRMHDHGAVEKTGPLPEPLSLKGQPQGADPDVGDVGYYAPNNDLVFYYGDQSYFPGIIVIGRMAERAVDRLASMDGSITATVSLWPS